ncbi:MAG TPA: aminotransferase class V-fold PLP-dependent enzyme [Gemmatimonadaceae bacterium]
MTSRRQFLRRTATLSAASAAGLTIPAGLGASPSRAVLELARAGHPLPAPPTGSPETVAQDEAYWREIAVQYAITDKATNLEAGYWGMMANPVLAAYHRNVDRVNRESSYFARREYPAITQAVRERVARALGVDAGEIAFARNATEALQSIIGQYRRVGAGDVVIYADLDYPAMQMAVNALAARRGATVATFDIPEPATRESITAAYAKALDAQPKARLLLLTHPNNKTGLMLPVREIADLARERGVDTVLDAAHAFGQFPISLRELGVPFAGVNLHKWVGAPLGVAAMYIRRDALEKIDRAHGDDGPLDRIDSRIHTGTTDFAAVMTVPDALDFMDGIGVPRKAARLRYLRDSWVRPARSIRGVDILTPDEPGLAGAITSFRLQGNGDRAHNVAISRTLLEEFGIFTVQRAGVAKGDCLRVTPALYNTPADTAKLVEALRVMAERG